jgi:hypothetical protein
MATTRFSFLNSHLLFSGVTQILGNAALIRFNLPTPDLG